MFKKLHEKMDRAVDDICTHIQDQMLNVKYELNATNTEVKFLSEQVEELKKMNEQLIKSQNVIAKSIIDDLSLKVENVPDKVVNRFKF